MPHFSKAAFSHAIRTKPISFFKRLDRYVLRNLSGPPCADQDDPKCLTFLRKWSLEWLRTCAEERQKLAVLSQYRTVALFAVTGACSELLRSAQPLVSMIASFLGLMGTPSLTLDL